jgi:hypothetical protein
MKYEYPTVSRPVTGKTADRIIEAVGNGGHVASPKAVQVMEDLYARFGAPKLKASKSKSSSNQPTKKGWAKRKAALKA